MKYNAQVCNIDLDDPFGIGSNLLVYVETNKGHHVPYNVDKEIFDAALLTLNIGQRKQSLLSTYSSVSNKRAAHLIISLEISSKNNLIYS